MAKGMPTTDRGAIQQIIRALKADGWVPVKVNDGEEVIKTTSETAMVEAIMAVDEAHAFFRREVEGPAGERGYVYFVLGNEPFEVACDYTVNLTAVDRLTDSWI